METQAQAEKVIIGRIIGLFGVRGWLKIRSYTEPHDNIANYSPWFCKVDGEWRQYTLEAVQVHGKSLIAKLESITDRDMAVGLLRSDIAVAASQLPPLQENEYYWRDLLGLKVVNLAGIELGIVDHLLETGANDVLAVQREGREMLIPYIPGQVIKAVDLAAGQMQVDWQEDY